MTTINRLLTVFVTALISLSVTAKTTGSYPASITELTISSQGSRMSGLIYQASGKGPHPTLLLLHGYPGNEKNLDVAQAMRTQGWNVVFFHYRGAWGSEGEFSFRGAEQDVQTVLRYISEPETAKKLRIDRDKLSLIGHSMGGHMAMAGFLNNEQVNCVVTYDGANLGADNVGFINDPDTRIGWKNYGDSLFMLAGWSGAKAEQEVKTYGAELNLVNKAHQANDRPIMIIAADTEVIPIQLHIKPLVKALKVSKNHQLHYKLINDDHSFSSSRTELIKTTATFLTQYCR